MTISDEQQAFAEGALLLASILGVGGDRWDVYAPSGDGSRGPVTLTLLGVWTGYVKRSKNTTTTPGTLTTAAPGTPVPATIWELVGESDQVVTGATPARLATGMAIVSQADPTLRYRVGGLNEVVGYTRRFVSAAPGLAIPGGTP